MKFQLEWYITSDMNIETSIENTRDIIRQARVKGAAIGLVPTMGALHAGHYALVQACREQCGFCAVSIFVNPTQFGPNEDLDRYPRTFEADCRGCRDLGVDLVFAPTVTEMYPDPSSHIWVTVDTLSDCLCGASRPDHFRGVCTVVSKLFHIIQPDLAFFGRKDAQQLAIIRRMVRELDIPVEIIGCPTVRESDGLALSSRNRYLNAEERRQAVCLFQALQSAADAIRQGVTDCQGIIANMRSMIEAYPACRIDYIEMVDSELLQPISHLDQPALLALAVFLGATRLIDNMSIEPQGTCGWETVL